MKKPARSVCKGLSVSRVDERHLIDKLRLVGLDKYIELPQIVVMGDTSSGKSSVLSALSGIEFPSSDQLTTRCPTQLLLSRAEQFSGSVRLIRYKTTTTANDDNSKATRLASTEEIASEIERLTRQLLNEGQVISDDAIVIDVRGPEFPNLTLTDLPGLIRTVGDDEDPAMIARVRSLVNRYLKQERTVILAVVPGNVDMHNVEILQAAEEADPKGMRTVSIITKPDLIDKGAESSVLELLMNRKKKLRLGYHVVRCRGQSDLNNSLSIQQGLENEATFFATHPVWSNVPAHLKDIGHLSTRLSAILENIIGDALPQVIGEIDTRLDECKANIKLMGPAMDSTTSRRQHYNAEIERFLLVVGEAMTGKYESSFFNGDHDHDGAKRMARALMRAQETQFREKLQQTKVDDEADDRAAQPPVVGELVEEFVGDKWLISKVATVHSDKTQITTNRTPTWLEKSTRWRHMAVASLSKLKALIQERRGDELAIFPSYSIFATLIRALIVEWDAPISDLLAAYASITARVVGEALGWCELKLKRLHNHVQQVVERALRQFKDEAEVRLQKVREAERRPYTLNHYLYDILGKLRTEPLINSLKMMSNNGTEAMQLEAVVAILKSHGVGGQSNEEREAQDMQTALKAYFKVAKKRVIDTVPMVLQQSFVEPFVETVSTALKSPDDKLLASIMAETDDVVRSREQLRAELEALERAKHECEIMKTSV